MGREDERDLLVVSGAIIGGEERSRLQMTLDK